MSVSNQCQSPVYWPEIVIIKNKNNDKIIFLTQCKVITLEALEFNTHRNVVEISECNRVV